jgi:predicted homoserine dehydrogenase-like protein
MSNLLPSEQMLTTGLVDYSVGAAPHTGAWVIVHEEEPLKKAQLAYYRLGDGPFFVFYTPFHLPYIQIASTIARAFIQHDPTVTPIDGPVCEVLTMAKRDLKAGERLDGVGGFCAYECGTRHGSVAHFSLRRVRVAPGYLEGQCDLFRRCGRIIGWSGRNALARTAC